MTQIRSPLRILLAGLLVVSVSLTVDAKGAAKGAAKKAAHKAAGSSAKTSKPKSTKPESAQPKTAKTPAVAVARDTRGRIQRSDAARHAFARQSGYPNGRPGYVIDHIVPLACGGADAPSNMQWQTVAAGKTKDKTERVGCH